MLAIFRDGGDVHGETAALILGDRQARQSAKPINFGCLYGGGAERLRITARTNNGIEFSADQARQHHAGFFTAHGGLQRVHQSRQVLRPWADLRHHPIWPKALGRPSRHQGHVELEPLPARNQFPGPRHRRRRHQTGLGTPPPEVVRH